MDKTTLMPDPKLMPKPKSKNNARLYIGIDNGITGTMGIISTDDVEPVQLNMPIKSEQNYTKKKGNISRIDFPILQTYLKRLTEPYEAYNIMIALERPMINSGRFKATVSAARALEATLIVIESLDLPFRYIDSREWQKKMLPAGTKGSDELKKASLQIGKRLFPYIEFKKDADGILIAEYMRKYW